MPVFRFGDRLHFFAHIPKCGGQTVESYIASKGIALGFIDNTHLSRAGSVAWTDSSPQHAPWADVARLLPEAWFDTMFAVVRHPLRRFVSAYNHRLWDVLPDVCTSPVVDPTAWWRRYLRLQRSHPHSLDNHLRPQVAFFPERAAVFRLEDGLAPVAALIDSITDGQPGPRIAQHNVSAQKYRGRHGTAPVPLALQEELIAHYHDDFARLGYEPVPIEGLTVSTRLNPAQSVAGKLRWQAAVRWRAARQDAAVRLAAMVAAAGLKENPLR